MMPAHYEINKSGQITWYLPDTEDNVKFLEKEKARIEKASGDTCEIVTDPFNGKKALFYKHVYYHNGERKNK